MLNFLSTQKAINYSSKWRLPKSEAFWAESEFLQLVLMLVINVTGLECYIKCADTEHVNITVLQHVQWGWGTS